MGTSLLMAFTLVLAGIAMLPAQDLKPTWELGKDIIDPALITGQVALVDGVVTFDGTNSFTLPLTVLGAQNDYTIEFEVKRAAEAKGDLMLVSNTDDKLKTGLGLRYYPPAYNAIWMYANSYRTVEQRGFLGKDFDQVTIVAKDQRLTLFRNGLIIAATDVVKPSALPLTFGEVRKEATTPYALRHVRVFDTALFPTGSEQAVNGMMRYCSGDQYQMQRVELKDPSLPRILIIGDSISGGYRGTITAHFKGTANIDYWLAGNWNNLIEGENSILERAYTGALSNGPYDVITFNIGLHSWIHPERSPEDKYIAQMTKLVEHIRKTAPKAKLIWVKTTPTTTPVDGKPSTINLETTARIIRFNAMTDGVMHTFGIPEVDLYGLCERHLDTAAKDGIHWNGDAYRLMGEEISAAIAAVLPVKPR